MIHYSQHFSEELLCNPISYPKILMWIFQLRRSPILLKLFFICFLYRVLSLFPNNINYSSGLIFHCKFECPLSSSRQVLQLDVDFGDSGNFGFNEWCFVKLTEMEVRQKMKRKLCFHRLLMVQYKARHYCCLTGTQIDLMKILWFSLFESPSIGEFSS